MQALDKLARRIGETALGSPLADHSARSARSVEGTEWDRPQARSRIAA